ncbi:coiled-coil domain-containing protein [Mycoplasma sp. Z631]|uniref:coiled-coil domain-containing protein n=1 Tax=Mycoplasma sp. Z631 TaxID=3401685 RepID=UPI003AAD2672
MKKIFNFILVSCVPTILSFTIIACNNTESSTPEDKQMKLLIDKIQLLEKVEPNQYQKYSKVIKEMTKNNNKTLHEISTYIFEVEEIINQHQNLTSSITDKVNLINKMINNINAKPILAHELLGYVDQANKLISSITKLNISQTSIEILKNKLLSLNLKIEELDKQQQTADILINENLNKLNSEIDVVQAQLVALNKTRPQEAKILQSKLQNNVLHFKNSLNSIQKIKELLNTVKDLENQIQVTSMTPEELKNLELNTFSNLKKLALELITKIDLYDVDSSNKYSAQINQIADNLSSLGIEEIKERIEQLKQLMQECNEYLSIRSVVVKQIESILNNARTNLLTSLNKDIYKNGENNLYSELIEYLDGVNNLNIPNNELIKLQKEISAQIEKVKIAKEKIDQEQLNKKKQLNTLRIMVDNQIESISRILNKIQRYDNDYAIGIKGEINNLKDQSTNVISIIEMNELVNRLTEIEQEIKQNLKDRNDLINTLSIQGKKEINNYANKINQPLFSSGSHNLLVRFNEIEKILSQNFNDKTLGQLRTIQTQYSEMFEDFKRSYKETLQEAENIKTIALDLKEKLNKKSANNLNSKEKEIMQFINNLPLDHIEFLSGNSLISTLQKVQEYQAELEETNIEK